MFFTFVRALTVWTLEHLGRVFLLHRQGALDPPLVQFHALAIGENFLAQLTLGDGLFGGNDGCSVLSKSDDFWFRFWKANYVTSVKKCKS
jgi:hypothetical protein